MRTASYILLSIVFAPAALAGGTTVTLDAKNMALSDAAKLFLDQTGIQVVLDTGVSGSVTAKLEGVEIEQALNVLAQANDLRWQKLYAQPDESGKIPMDRVKAQIDALAALQNVPLAIYDPATKQQTIFARIDQSTSEQAIDPAKLGLKVFYFVFKPKPPEAKEQVREDPARKLADLRRQQMEAFLRMNPEQQRAAAEQEMMWMLNLPQDVQVRLIAGMFEAARNMDPALRDQFRHTMREALQGMRGDGRRGR